MGKSLFYCVGFVKLPIRVYEKLVADSEELEDIKEYHKAKTHKRRPRKSRPTGQLYR